ncbi:hypothetical protein ACE1AT_26465 [Pelatocladus sp. BLCC-F211]
MSKNISAYDDNASIVLPEPRSPDKIFCWQVFRMFGHAMRSRRLYNS